MVAMEVPGTAQEALAPPQRSAEALAEAFAWHRDLFTMARRYRPRRAGQHTWARHEKILSHRSRATVAQRKTAGQIFAGRVASRSNLIYTHVHGPQWAGQKKVPSAQRVSAP